MLPPPEAGSSSLPRVPALERLLARATRNQSACEDSSAWLCHSFGVRRQSDWPVAPLALLGEARDPGRHYWLCADPVHLQVHGDKVVLAQSGAFAVTAAEAEAVVRALNAHFGGDGYEFVAAAPGSWYLRAPGVPELQTVGPEAAAGRDIDLLIPAGRDRMRYHGLLNEIQMLLHAHPVNEAREGAGAPALNSVWLWGGGTLPEVQRPWTAVHAESALLKGLCRQSGTPTQLHGPEGLPPEGNVLVEQIVRAGTWAQSMQRLDETWIAPLAHRLGKGTFARLQVATVVGGRLLSWTLDKWDLRKIWRRPRPLDALLREALP